MSYDKKCGTLIPKLNLLINYTVCTAKIILRIPFDNVNECMTFIAFMLLLHRAADTKKNDIKNDEHNVPRRKKCGIKTVRFTYILNTGGEFKLSERIPTIFPSDKPQIISFSSGEMVKQSMWTPNPMTFVFWLLPPIKSFSNKCITLSMATTTFSLRNVACKFGSC